MKVDWQKVILNLRQVGVSTRLIQNTAKMDESTVRRFARGEANEPKFSQGMGLLDLHEKFCPDRHNLRELSL